MRKRALQFAWHAAVIVLVGAACWYYIDFQTIVASLQHASVPWILLLIVLGVADRFLMAIKWHWLLRAVAVRVQFSRVLNAYFQAGLMQRFLPSSLGGDALRAVLIARSTAQQGTAVLGSMVVEKLVAMLSSAILAAIGLSLALLQLGEQHRDAVIAAIALGFVAIVLGVVLSFNERLVNAVLARLPKSLAHATGKVYAAYVSYRLQPAVLLLNLLMCLLEQTLQVGIVVLAAVSIGTDATVLTLVAALAIAQCLRKFAILTEGWVLGEFTTVFICGLFGIDQSQALAFSLLAHATDVIASLPGGVLFARSAGGLTNARRSLAEAAANAGGATATATDLAPERMSAGAPR